jgi:hypothetical protein
MTVGERFKPKNLESFDPVTQELCRPAPCKNPEEKLHTGTGNRTTCAVLSAQSNCLAAAREGQAEG